MLEVDSANSIIKSIFAGIFCSKFKVSFLKLQVFFENTYFEGIRKKPVLSNDILAALVDSSPEVVPHQIVHRK